MKRSDFLLLALLCTLSIPVFGQAQRSLRDIDYLRGTNPWLGSSNASGIGLLQTDRVAEADAFFRKDNGGLVDSNGSSDAFKAGANTESFVKISDKIAFYGKLSYDYFMGKNMGGSVLSDPSSSPINIVEYSQENLGKKVKEHFHIVGGMSYTFNEKWALGFSADYSTGNQVKRKDPRYSASLMDLSFSVGARFQPSKKVGIGLNALYTKSQEGLKSKIFGTTDKTYYSFIDYGAYFGSREIFDGTDTYLTTSTKRMLVNHYYGGALQLVFGERNKFFNEFTFLKRSGYYGRRTTESPIFTEHSGYSAKYEGNFIVHSPKLTHRIHLDAQYEALSNEKNVFKINYESGKGYRVDYSGSQNSLERKRIEGSLSYTGYIGGEESFCPEWRFGAAITGYYLTQTTTIFPFYRDHSVFHAGIDLFMDKNFMLRNNVFSLGFVLNGEMGGGVKNSDGQTVSSTSPKPLSGDGYLAHDFEYQTSPSALGALRFRYTRIFSDKFSAYLQAEDSYRHMLKKSEILPKASYNIFTFSIGFIF